MSGKCIFTARIAALIFVIRASEDHRFPEIGRHAVVYARKDRENERTMQENVSFQAFGVRSNKGTPLDPVRLANRIAMVIENLSQRLESVYYEDVHPTIMGQLDLLEEHGLVKDVTPVGNNAKIYRMSEKLVSQLLTS